MSTLVFNAQTLVWTLTSTGIINYTHAAPHTGHNTEAVPPVYPSPAYTVEPETVPFDPIHLTGGTFWKLTSGPDTGKYVSAWTNALGYGDITVVSDYTPPVDSDYPTINPLADWRILIKGLGTAGVTQTPQTVTVNATTNRYSRTSAGIISPVPVPRLTIPAGGPYKVNPIVVPEDPITGSGGSFWRMVDGPYPGWLLSKWTNELSYGDITVSADATAGRGPGAVIATLYRPNAHLAGFSINYNSPGELHFTLLVDDPSIDIVLPKQTHATVEFWIGSPSASEATRRASYDAADWEEVWAGMIWDQDATDTETVFYGVDYLGLLQYCVDERFDVAFPAKAPPTGSKYSDKTIKYVVDEQLDQAIAQSDSIVGFIARGTTCAMDEKVTIYSTMAQTLPFVVGLIDSHRAGTGKNTRLSVQKTVGDTYEFVIEDNPGVNQDGKMLRYGDLAQGYRVIQFGTAWASRVNLIARARDGTSLLYKSDSSGIDQAEWGRIAQAPVIIELIDKNDLARRAKQVALDAARLGRQVSVGLKLGSFRPLEDYAICDNLPVEINHGSVTTKDWASDVFGADAAGDASEVNANYWTILGLSWESYDDGHWMTNFALVPKGGGRARGGDCGATLVQSRAAAGSNLSSFALASAPAPGNLLVLAICSSAASLGAEPDLTTGWTRVHRIDGPEFGGYRWLEIWTRIAVSGDGASFGLSRNSGAGGVTCAYDVSEWSGGACGAVSVDDLAFDEITVNDFSGGGDTRTVTVTPTDARATTVFAVGWSGDNDTREPVEQGLTWASPLSEQSEQVQTNRGYVGVATVALSAGAAQSVTVTGIGATTPGSFAQTLLIAVNLVSGSFSYDVVSDPIVTPVESSTGWGPPTATTTSDTYTDLATGVVYERNDDTEVYDVVPGTGSVVDFTFTASVQWVINHTMGGYPRVTLRDTGGVVIDAEIVYTSTTVITVNFSSAVAGAAHLG